MKSFNNGILKMYFRCYTGAFELEKTNVMIEIDSRIDRQNLRAKIRVFFNGKQKRSWFIFGIVNKVVFDWCNDYWQGNISRGRLFEHMLQSETIFNLSQNKWLQNKTEDSFNWYANAELREQYKRQGKSIRWF